MTNEKRLAIALENLLRDMPADVLKSLCNDTVDSLVKSLPKERGGSKVVFEGRSHGKGTAQPSAPKRASGSLSVK